MPSDNYMSVQIHRASMARVDELKGCFEGLNRSGVISLGSAVLRVLAIVEGEVEDTGDWDATDRVALALLQRFKG